MSDTSDAIVGGIGAVVGLGVMDRAARLASRRQRKRKLKKVKATRAPAGSWTR